MTILNLIVLTFAVARISRFVGWDGITKKIRQRLTGYDDETGKRNNWKANHRSIAEMISCPFCFSAWCAVAVWLLYEAWPHATMLAAWPIAIAGAAGLIGKNWDSS